LSAPAFRSAHRRTAIRSPPAFAGVPDGAVAWCAATRTDPPPGAATTSADLLLLRILLRAFERRVLFTERLTLRVCCLRCCAPRYCILTGQATVGRVDGERRWCLLPPKRCSLGDHWDLERCLLPPACNIIMPAYCHRGCRLGSLDVSGGRRCGLPTNALPAVAYSARLFICWGPRTRAFHCLHYRYGASAYWRNSDSAGWRRSDISVRLSLTCGLGIRACRRSCASFTTHHLTAVYIAGGCTPVAGGLARWACRGQAWRERTSRFVFLQRCLVYHCTPRILSAHRMGTLLCFSTGAPFCTWSGHSRARTSPRTTACLPYMVLFARRAL